MKRPITFSLLIAVLLCCLITSCSDDNNKNDDDRTGGGDPLVLITLESVRWTQNGRTDSVICLYGDKLEPIGSKYYESKELISKQDIKYGYDNNLIWIEKTVGDKAVSLLSCKSYSLSEKKFLRTTKTDDATQVDTLYMGYQTTHTKSNISQMPVIEEIHYESGYSDTFEYDAKGNLIKITKGDDAVVSYTYDDKAGYGRRLSSSLWLYYCSDIPFNGYTNAVNNKLSKTVSYKNGEEEIYLYAYTFDSDSMPLTMTVNYTRKDKDGQVVKTDKTDYKFMFNKRILY